MRKESGKLLYVVYVVKQLFKLLTVINCNKIPLEGKTLGNAMSAASDD